MSINLKAKTEKKNLEKKLVDPQKGHFLVLKKNQKNVSSYFSFLLALKTIDTQMLF